METLERFREFKGEVEKLMQEHPELFYTENNFAESNAERVDQGIRHEFDLIEMIPHHPTCEKCAILQDRVYSISGKDKRFPPLSMVYEEGTNLVHKGCKHTFCLWAEMMYTPEEIEETIKRSNRPFVDDRTQEQKDMYDRLQYYIFKQYMDTLDYKKIQKLLPDIAPKSFSGYRRMKNGNTNNYKKLVQKAAEVGLDIDKYR